MANGTDDTTPDPSAADPSSAAATNPALTAALLYGGGGAGYGFGGGYGGGAMANPALLMLQPQLSFGQHLLAQASDVSPVRSPWQAAARAIGGLVGGYETRQYGQGMQQILGQQAQERQLADLNYQRIMAGGGGTPQAAPAAAPVQTPQPGKLQAPVTEPASLSATYDTAASSSGIPRNILVAKDHVESGFNNDAVSSTGAAGIPQILASTADNPGYNLTPLGAENRTNPDRAIPFGANYLAARGKAIYGDKWDPNNPTMLHDALKAYGDGTDAYANKVMAAAGITPPGGPTVTAASNVTVDPNTGTATIGGVSTGMAQANALRAEAIRRSMSYDPQLRATAPLLMQQATAIANQGAWKTQVLANGQIQAVNINTGEPRVMGAARQLVKDSADNLVASDTGQVVVPHGQYTVLSPNFGPGKNQLLVQGPDGKFATVGEAGRPEQTLRDDFSTLLAQWQKDPASMSAADRIRFGNTIQQLYPTKTEFIPGTNTPRTITPVPPPPGTPSLEELTGAKPPATAAAPAAAPQTETQVKAEAETYNQRLAEANKYVTDMQTQADNTRTIVADTQAIRDLVPKIQTGPLAEMQLEARNLLAQFGVANADDVLKTTDAQALQKLFLKMSFDAVSQLGKREPGSLVQMTMSRYPSLETQPGATEIVTRAADMQQRYHEDRIAAVNSWLADQTSRATAGGTDPQTGQPRRLSDFKGIGDFASSGWDKTHSPRVYGAAALAAAGQPQEVWQGGLTDVEKKQALTLAYDNYPGVGIMLQPQSGKGPQVPHYRGQ